MGNEPDRSVEEKQEHVSHKSVIEAEPVITTEDSNSNTGKLIGLIVIALLLLICLSSTAYLAYQGQKLKRSVGNQLSDMLQVVEKSQQQIKADYGVTHVVERERMDRLEQQQNVLVQTIQQTQAQQSEIVGLVAKRSQEKPDSHLAWGLMEAEYLVVIAMHRLLLEADVATAIAALETAESRLKDLSEPGLIPIRGQLTKDINALKAVNQVDITGPALYLADLIARVDSLPLQQQHVVTHQTTRDADEGTAAFKNWRQIPQVIWNELRSLVIIKKSSEDQSVFILPEEAYFIYQNLKLELNNARMSLLLRDEQNLKASILLIESRLSRYFLMNDAAVSNLLESLKKMSTLQLKSELPDISDALQAVKAFRRSYRKGSDQ